MNPTKSSLTTLLGTASFLTLASSIDAYAQPVAQAQTAQAMSEIPEQVLITGSLIRGAVAVGVPVTNLGAQDFAQTGSLTTADLFRTVPAANLSVGVTGTDGNARIERGAKVNLRGLDTAQATRSLLMVDGLRFPPQGTGGVCAIDPSIIPSIAMDRLDVLVDGASATYGSDAVVGVMNIILKRAYDGAVTQLRYTGGRDNKQRYQASQLWGRTWDGGDITLSYEWYDDGPVSAKEKSRWTLDFTPWGLDNRTMIASSIPGTISAGAPIQPASLGFGTSAAMGTNCTNCFAIPAGAGTNFSGTIGPTAPFSASTINWSNFAAANGGTNGVRNVVRSFDIAQFEAANQRNAAVLTVDQRLTSNVSFFGTGFYSNRRAEYRNASGNQPTSNDLLSVAVPTWNPYYPTGGAPTNLRVNYDIGLELPPITIGYETAQRYHAGLNIDLPRTWSAKVFYAMTRDESHSIVHGPVNKNAVSAALGWTLPPTIGTGTFPTVATWTKPATVPYLNLFCDPHVFTCNSQTTLNYFQGIRDSSERYFINEKGITFDGPLFSLPGGQVKAAVGADYTSTQQALTRFENTSAPNLLAPYTTDALHRAVWAVFSQVNIPIVGDDNALPGIARFDFEASWRHDQYSDLGSGTSNPKLAFNWLVDRDVGLTIRGAWGNSFRAPGFGELSALGQTQLAGFNLGALFPSNSAVTINCDAPVGSAAYRLLHPTVGPALNGGACDSNAAQPGGYALTGAAAAAITAGWRDYVNTDNRTLKPETAYNWAIGAEFAPMSFLRGLDIQATWYQLKITSTLRSAGVLTSNLFNTGAVGFAFIVPTDLFPVDPACNNNNTPATCPEFEALILKMMSGPTNTVPLQAQTSITWLYDGGTFNRGWLKVDGIDFTASYDWDTGEIGAFNAGITGTYYLHNESVTIPGAPGDAGIPQDVFHNTLASVGGVAQAGVESLPRFRYRARAGWASGPWSATLFMDYQSHYFHTQAAPPNVNFQCATAGGTRPGGSFPCAISNYTNIQPSYYSFDLSLGYDTGDVPLNDYLKNIGIQLVVQNLLDRDPAFQYKIGGPGGPASYDILKSYGGRSITLILTKTW